MKLLTVDTIEQAREKLLLAAAGKKTDTVPVPLGQALGRILADDLVSPVSVPDFAKSVVDGYAVKAKNTQGVTDSIPVFLDVVDQVKIGTPAKKPIEEGQCAYVPTGGMIPPGADAMLMIEYCEKVDENSIAVYESAAPGKNIISIGEDVNQGDLLLKVGTRLRSQEIGALAAVGITEVPVFGSWKMTILSTGDELVAADQKTEMGQIHDINTNAIEALGRKFGFEIIEKRILQDQKELLKQAVDHAILESDLLVMSGGSSQGDKDYTADVLNEAGSPGVFTHGIALKPGKPTILGYDDKNKTILMGLPGHPAAAILVFELLGGWLYRQLTHQPEEKKLTAVMENNVAGAPGRATCLLVELIEKEVLTARPILGKSGLITTLTRAQGYTMIPMNQEGIKAGEQIEITLL